MDGAPVLQTFLLEFDHGGKLFEFDIPAYSREDAEGKLASIRSTGRIVGRLEGAIEVGAIVPGSPLADILGQRMVDGL